MFFNNFPLERPADLSDESVWIFHRLPYGYLGLDSEGLLSALFPVNGKLPLMGRIAGSLRIDYRAGVKIQADSEEYECNCCVVSVPDRDLDRSFWALAQALSQELCVLPSVSAPDFVRAFSGWEQLFQKRARLSLDEEQGLWGELYFLSSKVSVDSGVACWRGPNAEDYDFLSDGLALEVKTSRRIGRHHVSHAQVVQATEPGNVFLVSIWVGEDPFHGVTLPEMIDLIADIAADKVAFEKKLLETGYSHQDRGLYERAFSVLDSVTLHDMVTVPRVRDIDPGVMSLSYVVQLDPETALPDSQVVALLLRMFP